MRITDPRPGVLLAVALLAAPTAAQKGSGQSNSGARDDAPDREIVYNWGTGGLAATEIRSGQTVRFRVVDVNPLCYNAVIRAEPTEATVDVKELATVLQGGSTQATAAQAGAKAPPAPATPNPQASSTPPGRLPALAPGRNQGPSPEEIERLLQTAKSQIEVARTHLGHAERDRAEASAVIETLNKPPCDVGRGFNFQNLVARWRALQDANGTALSGALAQLQPAEQALASASAALSRTGVEGAKSPQGVTADALRAQHDTLNGLRLQLKAALPGLQTALTGAGRRLTLLEETARLGAFDQIRLGQGTERVKVTVQNHVVAGSGAPTLPDVVREVPVRRRFRPFLSTGVLVTTIDQPHYDQVHRPVVRNDTTFPDSTYITYAAQTRGPLSAISPAVQLNISVFDLFGWEGVPGLVSFGATTRSVNGSQGVEPFAGISLGLVDRLVGTFGWHVGRREQLLLARPGESPEDVEKRPVPQGISRTEAVGTRWTSGFFFSFSIKT